MVAKQSKFENRVLEKLYQAIEIGMPYDHAALYAGIHPDTFLRWRKGNFPKTVKAKERDEFLQRMDDAEGKAVMAKFLMITQAAKGNLDEGIKPDWHAAAWMLERRYPNLYSRHVVDVTHRGDEDEPIKIDMTKRDENLREFLEELPTDVLEVVDEYIDATTRVSED